MSTRKIEVYTFPNYDRILYKAGVLEVSTIPHLDIQTPATLIIGGKAFTEEEHEAEFQRRAKAMLSEISTGIYRGKVGEGPQHTIKSIAARHGVQLP